MKTTQSHSRPGFTLTEVLIALALISFLMVGISRIFTMTSSTISVGQATSRGLRVQKTIHQTLSNDILGYSSTGRIEESDERSGIMPFVVSTGSSRGAPFLTISNFRISAFDSEADRKAGPYSPADTLSPFDFAAHSNQVRTIDDGNGGTIRVPIYSYGHRNFRVDTIGFFSQGLFQSQTAPFDPTGNSVKYQNDLTSKFAYVFYGHPRIFTGDISRENDVDAYGAPGSYMVQQGATSTYRPNINQRFANQFTLGRVQMLCIEPEATSIAPATMGGFAYQYKTVASASGQYVPFVRRNWDNPSDIGNTLSPLLFDSLIYQYREGNGLNAQLQYTGAPAFGEAFSGGVGALSMRMGRTDILGAGIDELRARATHLEANQPTWRDFLPNKWADRMLCNPFMPRANAASDSLFSARVMSQRQQVISDSVSQFIVEYAGDFISQGPNGAFIGRVPDGVIDFVEIAPDMRQIRWYGLPRDVNGDGVIAGTGAAMRTSPDVIPLRDFAGGPFLFEDIQFNARANYLDQNVTANVNEPAGFTTPTETGYLLTWGPREFETAFPVAGVDCYQVPQLIRFVVDAMDTKGQKTEPVTQEYVFPVKVQSN